MPAVETEGKMRSMLQRDCIVTPEGDTIIVTLRDRSGRLCEVALSFDEASSLAMTLPRLLKMALRRRYSDESLRHIYPLSGYEVEPASDLRHLIITLSANGGFEVAFAIGIELSRALAQDLDINGKFLTGSPPALPH